MSTNSDKHLEKIRRMGRQMAGLKCYCEDQIKAHKMTPAARDCLLSEFERSTEATNSDELSLSFEGLKKFFEKNGKVLSAGMLADALAREYCAKHQSEYGPALKFVLTENPELAKLYVMESSNPRGCGDE